MIDFLFLDLFKPKNFDRQSPITYIFLVALVFFVVGLIFFSSLKVLAVIGFLLLTVLIAGPAWIIYQGLE
jgi:hypothetical protein